MKNGDISRKPAKSIAFNFEALFIPVDSKGLLQAISTKVFGKEYLVEPNALKVLSRLAIEFNTYCLVDTKLINHANTLIEKNMLPVTKCYACPDFDHYALVRHVHQLEVVLWVGEKSPFDDGNFLTYPNQQEGWFGLLDFLEGRLDER